jgi:glycyl-tRNA synthetase beta chain
VTAHPTMNRENLLVELLVEELPPKALDALGNAFGRTLAQELASLGLIADASAHTAFASPRRLAVHVRDVASVAPDVPESKKLMPVKVALDADGKPTVALTKKVQAMGPRWAALLAAWPEPQGGVDRLFTQNEGKDAFIYYATVLPGVDIRAGLQQALLSAITQLPIPKVMTYQLQANCDLPGWSSVSFVRPAHGVVALHGSGIVPVQALGLDSGNTTIGHRFEARVVPVLINHADNYAEILERDGAVTAGFATRRAEIVRQLAAACDRLGGGVHAIDDAALLDEVTALVERPNVLVCTFDAQFLEVPQECLILTMKANQKYFPLLDAHDKLTNRFLVVSNISPADTGAVVGGNERVVRPRLADARFFFDQDRKKTLLSRVDGLSRVVYHNKLGSQGDRMLRVRAIAQAIAAGLGDAALAADADTAAQLAKTDLVTDMVGEFPELQGIMGGYYARHDGLGDAVAMAIEDHYKPRFAGDALPRNNVGLVVALADKLETLAGMFGIGNLPTGDKDPFALRRHALGVIRMLIERALPLAPTQLIAMAFAAFPAGMIQDAAEPLGQFLVDRLRGYLRDSGFSAGEVDAAIHAQGMQTWAELPLRLSAVRAFAALPEAPALAAANKRIGNILKKVPAADPHVSEVLLSEPAEKALHVAMQGCAPQAAAQFDAGDYAASLQTLAALRAPVDAFFEQVMVNAPELDLRLNRLGLLQALHNAMNRVADLSRLDSPS